MATGGGHDKSPPGRKPTSTQPVSTSSGALRGRKKEKQRSKREVANPGMRASSPVRRSTPAIASELADDEFMRLLQLQYGKKQAKRVFREQQDANAARASKKQHTAAGPAAAGTSTAAAGASADAATTSPAAGNAAGNAAAAAAGNPVAATATATAAAGSTRATDEDFETCEDQLHDEEDESHSSDSSPNVSSDVPESTITVTLNQLSTLVSNAVVNALPGILPQLASVLSPSRSADEPKVKYADPEIFTGAKGQNAETWYEDAKGLYAQRPPALKRMEFQRWLLNRVSEPVRTAFRAHVKDTLQVDYQEVQDWTIPADTLRKFLTGFSTMGDSKHRIYEDLTALKWTPKFIQQSLLSVLPILARAGGDPAFTVSGHIVVSLICNALKLQYPSLYMHVFVDPETRAPYVDHVKFLKAVSLWHQSLRSVAGNGNGHGNGVPGAVGNGPDKPKTPKQIQNPHPKKIKPHKPHNNQNDYTQNDSPVKEWTAHKGPLSDELKAEIVSAGGCIFCKRKGHVIADCERRNKMKGNNKNRKK